MRETKITLGGQEFTLRATFTAGMEMADTIYDPLAIARESAIEQSMDEAGIPYQPKFSFTMRNVPQILWIGAKAYDPSVKLQDVQEACFNEGLFNAKAYAVIYIASLVQPQNESELDKLPESDTAEK